MEKEEKVVNLPAIILSIFGIIVLALGVYVFLALHGHDYTPTYSKRISEGIIQNPIAELQFSKVNYTGNQKNSTANQTLSDIIHVENISGVNLSNLETKSINYMSVKLYLYNLHNIPLTDDNPRIQVYLDNSAYSIQVINGEIYVNAGILNNPDVIIRTTMDEVSKIVDNPEYAKSSIFSGKTSVQIAGSPINLLLKGYAKLYSLIPK